MDINPMMLLPLLMGNKEGDGNMQKMLNIVSGIQSGNSDALFELLGGDNEKMKNILAVIKTLQGNQFNFSANAVQNNEGRTAPEGLNNDEITRALNLLMSQKKT